MWRQNGGYSLLCQRRFSGSVQVILQKYPRVTIGNSPRQLKERLSLDFWRPIGPDWLERYPKISKTTTRMTITA